MTCTLTKVPDRIFARHREDRRRGNCPHSCASTPEPILVQHAKAVIDTNAADYPRARLESLVCSVYANPKVAETMRSKDSSRAAPRDPHALAINGFRRGCAGESGSQRSGSGGYAGSGSRKQQQQWVQGNGQLQKCSSGTWGANQQQHQPLCQQQQQQHHQQLALVARAVSPTTTASPSSTGWSYPTRGPGCIFDC